MQLLDIVRQAANKRILYTPHALTQMDLPERMVAPEDVRHVIYRGEVIEEYPNDPRGTSCLMFGWSALSKRPIHVVCAPKDEYLAIITTYIPSPNEWQSDFRERKK